MNRNRGRRPNACETSWPPEIQGVDATNQNAVEPTIHEPPAKLIRAGFDALVDKLGAAGAVRFMLHYDAGQGDYTRERPAILDGIDTRKALELTEQEEEV